MKKTKMLIVLDGWGHRTNKKHNAVAAAKKPFFDMLWDKNPHTLLEASGAAVGLPDGQVGNSEVGHSTIGSGRPADTDLVRINKAITSGEFAHNTTFKKLFAHINKHDSTLHLMGLISKSGVHGHEDHMFKFLKIAHKNKIKNIAIHLFTDGRDTPPRSGIDSIKQLEKMLKGFKQNYVIATISGRYYSMDRDNNWDRLEKVEKVMFESSNNNTAVTASDYVESQYKKDITDEYIEPTRLVHDNKNVIKKNDGIFMLNFRSDRARMITSKLLPKVKKQNLFLATMTEYQSNFDCPAIFSPVKIETTIAQELANAGFTQTHIAETEKFAHATYFLNGGREKAHKNEKDILVPSRKDVKTHDEAPEMKAKEIADAAIQEIDAGADFIFINFANPDIVGHTANVPAIIKAIETVDAQLKRVIQALEKKSGIAIIIADHGNAEINIHETTGEKHTAHTASLVPCILVGEKVKLRAEGGLSDIAPTVLELFDIKKPPFMTGTSLLS